MYTSGHFENAERNIPCIKVVQTMDDGVTVTPYMYTEITEQILKGEATLEAKSKRNTLEQYQNYASECHDYNRCYSVEDGAIHTFAIGDYGESLYNCVTQLSGGVGKVDPWVKMDFMCPVVKSIDIYLCEIPEGTMYVKGQDMHDKNGCMDAYASTSIRFKRCLARIDKDWNGYLSDLCDKIMEELRNSDNE